MSRRKKFLKKIKDIVKNNKVLFIIFGVTILVNILAWLAPLVSNATGMPNWCDYYAKYVNPVIVALFSRIMNIFKFSVGEILIVLGIILCFVFVIFSILAIVLRKKRKAVRIYKGYVKFFCYVLAVLCAAMTLNCSIYYHVTPLDGNVEVEYRQYTTNELEILRNYIVTQCNNYSAFMRRDENQRIVYEGDIMKESKIALRNISDKYPRLNIYHPDVKPMAFSNLMTQSSMAGYYFPFSLEANANSKMYLPNYPATYCHELAHIHGYIFEDEANFLAYLACIKSDDAFIRYSGYLSVLYYVDEAYLESINYDLLRLADNPSINVYVHNDNQFVLQEVLKEIEDSAIVPSDTMDKISDTFTETTLNMNGVSDGLASYGRVVDLMLQYYDGILY